MDDYLEDEYRDGYQAWKADPSPVTAGALLKQLSPVIDNGLARYAGRQAGPTLRSKAKQFTLDAIATYDSRRAQLSTHVYNQLKGLNRAARQERQVFSVPERLSIDAGYLRAVEDELLDKFGRDPTARELADHTGLSLKRIARIRQLKSPIPEGALAEDEVQPSVVRDRRRLLLDALYADESPANQKIIEWRLGLHGAPRLSNAAIAAKLGLSPGAVSQRAAKLQQKLDAFFESGVF